MARKATRSKARRPAPAAKPAPSGTPRERILAAFMSLLAEQPIERISLTGIAKEARVSLAELRGEFSTPLAILGAHVKDLDKRVLADVDTDLDDESSRDKLFDVLMHRLDLLSEHRDAVRSLMRSARSNPPLALALNAMTVRSQQWMMSAAGIGSSGPKGMIRAQGLALLFANVLRTWVDDDEENERTMAALDRELSTGQRLAGLLDDLFRIPEAMSRVRERMRETRGSRRGGRRGRGERAAA